MNNPKTPKDFRPISLCNVAYKIISKLIANRIKPLLDKIVNPTQAAFVKGRQIADNTIMVHEIMHTMRKSKQKLMACKIDIAKAYV